MGKVPALRPNALTGFAAAGPGKEDIAEAMGGGSEAQVGLLGPISSEMKKLVKTGNEVAAKVEAMEAEKKILQAEAIAEATAVDESKAVLEALTAQMEAEDAKERAQKAPPMRVPEPKPEPKPEPEKPEEPEEEPKEEPEEEVPKEEPKKDDGNYTEVPIK